MTAFVKLDVSTGKGGGGREVFVNADKITAIEPGDYEQWEPYVVHVGSGTGLRIYPCLGHHDELLAQITRAAT